MKQQRLQRALASAALVAALVGLLASPSSPQRALAQAQGAGHIFTETGHTLSGEFLDYWTTHGGVDLQGYPISEQMQEVSSTDGKTYTVQYFQRSEFQAHPENQAPQNVQLTLLGTSFWNQKYAAQPPIQVPNAAPGSQLFPQTGKRLGGEFLAYWQSHGGLTSSGIPSPMSSMRYQASTATPTRCSILSVPRWKATRKTRRPTTCCSRNWARFSTTRDTAVGRRLLPRSHHLLRRHPLPPRPPMLLPPRPRQSPSTGLRPGYPTARPSRAK